MLFSSFFFLADMYLYRHWGYIFIHMLNCCIELKLWFQSVPFCFTPKFRLAVCLFVILIPLNRLCDLEL